MATTVITTRSAATSNLIKDGDNAIAFEIKNNTSVVSLEMYVPAGSSAKCRLSDGYFTDNTGAQNLGQEIVFSQYQGQIFFKSATPTTGFLYIQNLTKSNKLYFLKNNKNNVVFNLSKSNMNNLLSATSGSISLYSSADNSLYGDVKKIITPIMSEFRLTGDLFGYISSFSKCKNCTRLEIRNTLIEGEVSDIPLTVNRFSSLYRADFIIDDLNEFSANIQYLEIGTGATTPVIRYTGSANKWQALQRVFVNGRVDDRDMDNFLKMLANASWSGEKKVTVKGKRTSASDDAVATLASKGVVLEFIDV